jgi:hypothetical protein
MENKYPIPFNQLTEENPWPIPPGIFGNSIDNIHIVKDFISEEDLNTLMSFTHKINNWDNTMDSQNHSDGASKYSSDVWKDRTCTKDIIQQLDVNVYNIIDKYINLIKTDIEKSFNCVLEGRPPVIVCWRPGDMQVPHADKQLQDGRPNAFVDYDINALFYLNDNYEGGELFYPNQGLKIKPTRGMAVFHPGDINYLHGVTSVLSGVRWVIPSFYRIESI